MPSSAELNTVSNALTYRVPFAISIPEVSNLAHGVFVFSPKDSVPSVLHQDTFPLGSSQRNTYPVTEHNDSLKTNSGKVI